MVGEGRGGSSGLPSLLRSLGLLSQEAHCIKLSVNVENVKVTSEHYLGDKSIVAKPLHAPQCLNTCTYSALSPSMSNGHSLMIET